ncbi:MAG TPA: hypothetical protein VF801_14480 [Rhodocyclaceae bacterium]
MPGNADQFDKDRRRDAVNAVRLMYLDHDSAAAAAKTFQLYPCDIAAARRVLEQAPPFRLEGISEQERVDYLLGAGWRKRKRNGNGS